MQYIPPVIPAPVKRLNLRDVSLRRVLVCIASLLIVSLSLARAVQSVSLAWDASPGPNVAAYKIYYGTNSGSLSQIFDAGNVTIAAVPNLNDATTYFFAVTAYNTAGESQRSNVVSYTTPATPVELYSLTVNNGTGSGEYPATAKVPVSANTAPQGQQFEIWDGDYAILDNRLSQTTTAFMIARDLTIYPTYSAGGTTGGTGLRGQYYNDGSGVAYPLSNPYTGLPVLTRTDATVDFDWDSGSPASQVNQENFSVKWTGQVKAPVSGSYTFTVTGDDGVRLFLNGAKVIDGWRQQDSTQYTYTTTLTAQTLYNIELHFYEQDGAAECRLHWSYPGQADQPIPRGQLYAVPTYGVTVTNGTGDGDYPAGAPVTVVADAAPTGQQFAGWTGNVTFTSPSSPTTTFTMPSSAVAITATYSAGGTTGGTGLRGQYYNDGSGVAYPLSNPYTGLPVLTRTDATVDFDWDSGSPASQVNQENFSVKWTGQVKAPVSGSYTFTVTGDDGVRLFLNGAKVIDEWRKQDSTQYTYTTTLTAQTLYNIELHFYEQDEAAECRLHWSYPGQADQPIPRGQLYAVPTYGVTVTNGTGDGNYPAGAPVTVVADAAPTGQQFAGWTGNVTFTSPSSPTTTFTMPSSAVAITATYSAGGTTGGTGLRGQYYNDGSGVAYPLSNPYTGLPVLTRTDATVDFDWDSGSPASQVNQENFSVKWTGQVKAPVSGSYTFTVTGDDGVRLFLNGAKVIDEWRKQDSTQYTYTTTLTAQTLYNIELHFYEQDEAAECRLHWSYPGQADQAIPRSQLYPSTGP